MRLANDHLYSGELTPSCQITLSDTVFTITSQYIDAADATKIMARVNGFARMVGAFLIPVGVLWRSWTLSPYV